MKSYKVEIEKTYCVDVQADTDKEAEDLAETMLDSYMKNGIEHYHQTGDTFFTAYDVTGTDDDAFLASTGGGCKEGLCVNCGKDITGNRNGQCPFCWDKK